jgi:hypothetical protein
MLMLCVAALAASACATYAAVEQVASGVKFTYRDAEAKAVYLAGDWNNWGATTTAMTKDGEVWSIVVPLSAGDHQYKFVVDGTWVADPDNPVTGGDFANSVVSVGPSEKTSQTGAAATGGPTAPTSGPSALNPKVSIDGRYLGTYIARKDGASGGQFQLTKPTHDLNVLFNVRINENMTAKILADINSSRENTEPWRTHLNFDRGRMDLRFAHWGITSFDNEGVVTPMDSLHVLGDVGIYRYPFGYNLTGAAAAFDAPRRIRLWGFYGDRNADGVRPSPLITTTLTTPIALTVTSASDTLRRYASTTYTPGSGILNENTAAAAAALPVTGSVSLALLYRNSRGANRVNVGLPTRSAAGGITVGGGLAEQTVYDDSTQGTATLETVRAYSTMEARSLGDATLTLENQGRAAWIAAGVGESHVGGLQEFAYDPFRLDATDPLPPPVTRSTTRTWNLARSARLQVGMRGRTPIVNDGVMSASVEFERHRYSALAFGGEQITGASGEDTVVVDAPLTNKRTTIRVSTFVPIHRFGVGVDVSDEIFRYAKGTPWGGQLWFAGANMWLDEHVLTVSRFTLLGGRSAAVIQPRATMTIGPNALAAIEYRGTLSTAGLSYSPSSVETRGLATVRLLPRLSAYEDLRVARYDAASLALRHTYVSNFAELRYTWTPQIGIELGFGVDPYVLDLVPNEYRDIGRDIFLFDQGANETAARTNYQSFGRILDTAEKNLAHERRISLEAKLTF